MTANLISTSENVRLKSPVMQDMEKTSDILHILFENTKNVMISETDLFICTQWLNYSETESDAAIDPKRIENDAACQFRFVKASTRMPTLECFGEYGN